MCRAEFASVKTTKVDSGGESAKLRLAMSRAIHPKNIRRCQNRPTHLPMPPSSSSRLSPEENSHTSSGLSPEEVPQLVPQLRRATWDEDSSADNSQSNSDHDMEGDRPSDSEVVPPVSQCDIF